MVLEWAQSGADLTGTAYVYDSCGAPYSVGFQGTVSGSSVTIQMSTGTALFSASGTISGNTMLLQGSWPLLGSGSVTFGTVDDQKIAQVDHYFGTCS